MIQKMFKGFKNMFNKGDASMARVVEQRFGGSRENNRFSAVQDLVSKVKYKIDAWKDTRKKKKKAESKANTKPTKEKPKTTATLPTPEITKKTSIGASMGDREDFPPIDQTTQKTKSAIARIAEWFPTEVTFSKKKIRKWNTKQTVGAIAVAGGLLTVAAGITTIVAIQVCRIIRENDLAEKLKVEEQKRHRAEIESYANIMTLDPDTQEKAIEAAAGRVTCVEPTIIQYATEKLPTIVVGSQDSGYLESLNNWNFNQELPIDQKLANALQTIDMTRSKNVTSIKTKISQEEFNVLAGKWFNDTILGWYFIDLRSEAEKIIKKNATLAPEKQNTGYINHLQGAIASVDIIDEYAMGLRTIYHERAEKYITRDMGWYESVKKKLEEIYKKDQKYTEALKAYTQDKDKGIKSEKPYSLVTSDDTEYLAKHKHHFELVQKDIGDHRERLILEDMRNERGQMNAVIREKNRRIRVLKWLVEVGQHTPIEKIDGTLTYIFPPGKYKEYETKPQEDPSKSADPEKSAR